jgi:uncharacterized protein YndB with AHSA1/START domain
MKNSKISVEATIKANVQKVWDYWTKPEHITKWNFASDDWQCPKAENELKAGGKYYTRMEAKDGSFGFDFEAVYDEVLDRQKMTYTLTDGRQVTTFFESNDGVTNVKTIFDAEKENSVDMQRQGWLAILNSFKKYVEAH